MKPRAFNLGLLLASSVTFFVQADQTMVVGKVSFAKGSNAAQQANTPPRLLGKEAEIYQGDNIQTSDASFVIVEFIDGSKVTIRPNSNFKIEQFDSLNKNAKLVVYEGGVRAETGEFSKVSADNFQIKTPNATVKGEKGSNFIVRVCKEDCDEKKESEKEASVAKVTDIKGEVFAQNRAEKNAPERKLTMGSDLYSQDFLTTQANSYLVMVFRDGEKVTLHPNSEFDIVKYDFQQPGKKDQILFKLAAGGMRAITGSIGKKDHSAYSLDTPVATIGIRGTDNTTMEIINEDGSIGVINAVHEGVITVSNEAGSADFSAGQFSSTTSSVLPPIQISVPPMAVQDAIRSMPAPENAPNFDQVSKNSSTVAISNSGNITIEKNTDQSNNDSSKSNRVTLIAGESGSLSENGERLKKLEAPPSIIAQDRTEATFNRFSLSNIMLFPPANGIESGGGCAVR